MQNIVSFVGLFCKTDLSFDNKTRELTFEKTCYISKLSELTFEKTCYVSNVVSFVLAKVTTR